MSAPQETIDPPLLTVREVMTKLRLSKPTVFALINSGTLPSFRFGIKAIRIDSRDVDAYMEACLHPAAKKSARKAGKLS